MRRPWRLFQDQMHPQLLLLQNQKWKQCKFLVFKEIFLERRGFSRVVNFLPRHLVSVAASGFSGSSVAVCTRPTTLLFSSSCSSLKGWGSCSTAEFIVGLTLKSLLACLTLQSALLSLPSPRFWHLSCSRHFEFSSSPLSSNYCCCFLYRLHICTHKKSLCYSLWKDILF